MMNELSDFNRNSRTLIISFVVAIMAMIPLRFVEVSQSGLFEQPMVLGEAIESQKIMVPEAVTQPVIFEAPYNETELTDSVLGTSDEVKCISREDADRMYEAYAVKLETVRLNEMQRQQVAEEILAVEESVCR